jgi:hypothetical protein
MSTRRGRCYLCGRWTRRRVRYVDKPAAVWVCRRKACNP